MKSYTDTNFGGGLGEGPDRVPLTVSQRARLLFDCIPLLFWVLVLIFCLTILPGIVGTPSLAIILFTGLIILVVAHRATQRLRDLASGVAVVQNDRLLWSRRLDKRGRGGPWVAEFEQLGRLYMTRRALRHSHDGQRYRVHYSPASKMVWLLEPTS